MNKGNRWVIRSISQVYGFCMCKRFSMSLISKNRQATHYEWSDLYPKSLVFACVKGFPMSLISENRQATHYEWSDLYPKSLVFACVKGFQWVWYQKIVRRPIMSDQIYILSLWFCMCKRFSMSLISENRQATHYEWSDLYPKSLVFACVKGFQWVWYQKIVRRPIMSDQIYIPSLWFLHV